MSFNLNDIQFEKNENGVYKKTDVFSDIAKKAAEHIIQTGKNTNTQIRRFYDELVMWNEKVQIGNIQERQSKFKQLEPFIKMMKAKAAYTLGRNHIDDNFYEIFNRTIDEIKSVDTLNDAKLFMEAIVGYCRYLGK